MAGREVPRVSRANAETIKAGTIVEQKEHPWASKQTARKIAADHIRENPDAYTGNCGENKTVTVRIKQIRPKKKVPPPPPSNAPDWIQPSYRLWG